MAIAAMLARVKPSSAFAAVLLVGCASAAPPPAAPPPAPKAPPTAPPVAAAPAQPTPPARGPLATKYGDTAAKILAAARADRGAYAKLQHLTDHIGNRISGSKSLEDAVAWAQEAMKADGHENVHAEKVMVPHWVRGEESADIVAPIKRPMVMVGLGMSPGTPKKGITAPIVVVKDFDELDALGDKVRGKIVVYNHAMPPYSPTEGAHYGETVKYRGDGPPHAAARGAVAVLIRSVTAKSLRNPHTGTTNVKKDVPTVPSAAVTIEDAELLARLAAEGEVVVHLSMGARTLPDAPSANVVGEIRGREKPDEVVVIGGHIDSWDVGQGAHDDGAGIVTMMQALTTIRKLGLQPRRTIRVVCFTNEENGLAGGRGYASQHADELGKTVAAIESDSGGFAPIGISANIDDAHGDAARAILGDVVSLLEPIHATRLELGGSGADVSPMVAPGGVPTLGLMVEGSRYFDYHHSPADTLDKVDPDDLALDVATVATVAFILADMDGTLPRGEGRPRQGP